MGTGRSWGTYFATHVALALSLDTARWMVGVMALAAGGFLLDWAPALAALPVVGFAAASAGRVGK